jgi:hypothetical protein
MNARCISGLLAGNVVLVLLGGAADGATITISAGSAQSGPGSDVVVPVSVQGAKDLGAIQLELVYDPAVLEPKQLDEGAALPPGVLDDNPAVAGRWKVGLASNKPFSGDGELFRFKFTVRGGSKSAVSLESAHVWDNAIPPLEMLVKMEAGVVTVGSAASGFGLYASIGGAAVVLLVLVAIVMSRRKRQSNR